jgi:hypothetical protein
VVEFARRPASAVVALAVAAGVWAMTISRLVLPYTSRNPDEALYLLQADTLRHGRLFPPAPTGHVESMLPLFSRYRDGHYVPKYPPVHAAVLAFGRVVFGTYRAGLAIIAAGLVVATYLLATEVLSSRRRAVLAAVFMAGSPLVLVESATFLAYLSGLVLLELFAWAFLCARRTQRSHWYVLTGLLLGTSYFARPYDTVLFALPFGIWMLIEHRHGLAELGRRMLAMAAGAAPPVLALLLYNRAATGNFLHTSFALDPSDTLGFGRHRIVWVQPYFDYTPGEALTATARHFGYMSFWLFGGAVTIALALAFVFITEKRPARVLATVLVTIPVGYFFFWGSSVATTISKGIRYFGPWYWVGTLAPLAVLAAGATARILRRRRVIGVGLLVAMVATSAGVTVWALGAHHGLLANERRWNEPLQHAPDNSLVFLQEQFILIPYKLSRNPTLDGPVLFARDLGPAENLDLARDFPARRPMQLGIDRGRPTLQPMSFVVAPDIRIDVEVPESFPGGLVIVERDGARRDCRVTAPAVEITIALQTATCSNGADQVATLKSPIPAGQFWITLVPNGSTESAYRWSARFDVRGNELVFSPPAQPELDTTTAPIRVTVRRGTSPERT